MTREEIIRSLTSLKVAALAATAGLQWGLLVLAASAGVVIYSLRFPLSPAGCRPEEIIARYISGLAFTTPPHGADITPWPVPVFPEDAIRLDVQSVLESRAAYGLRVLGTIVGVAAAGVGVFIRKRIVPSSLNLVLNIAAVAVFGLLGYRAGRWWVAWSGRDKIQERCLVHCFLAWLEREAGDPKAKHYDFGLTVISTARTSGFSLMKGLRAHLGAPLSEADDRAAAHRVVALARAHRYRWRRDNFRQWAGKVVAG